MSSEKLKAQWIARFKRVVSSITDDGWSYSRLEPEQAEAIFKEMDIGGYQIEAKLMVSTEKQGKGTKRKKHPGCMFRLMEK